MKKIMTLICILGLSGQSALAESKNSKSSSVKMSNMTTERQKAADAHERMSVCLRSDKKINDCHDEMMKSCKDSLGQGGCMMNDGWNRNEMNKRRKGGYMNEHMSSEPESSKE